MSVSKSWKFTLNNYSDQEIETIKSWTTDTNRLRVSKETGDNGTPHLQGAVTFKRSFRLSALKKLAPRAHWETARCADFLYEAKLDSEMIINHEDVHSGERTDLKQIQQRIANGTSVRTIRQENPMAYHQYGRTLDKLEEDSLLDKERSWMTNGIWLWGPTGCGKTHEAMTNYSKETHYVHNWNDKGWWDHYNGQEIVIFDDFRGQVTYSELLTLVDRYPKTVPRRGRPPVPFLAKTLYVTSALAPERVFHNLALEDSLDQLNRRFTVTEMQTRTL